MHKNPSIFFLLSLRIVLYYDYEKVGYVPDLYIVNIYSLQVIIHGYFIYTDIGSVWFGVCVDLAHGRPILLTIWLKLWGRKYIKTALL